MDLNYRTGRRKPGVKIELSKLKGSYRGQLVPFEGLWGFSQEADYYKGTIFRFPLRARTTQSKLIETGTPLNAEAVRICLDRFLEQEGRIALLFLRRIRFMDFRIYGDKEPRWSVHSDIEEGFSSGWVNCNITKCMNEKLDGLFRDRWWVAIQDPANIPKDLQYRHKMTMKDVECGIAALVPKPKDAQSPIFTHAPVPRYFSTLPLPFTTDLPVHIHTTFLLASDRASIPVEDSMRDAGAEWNRWLLSYAIPHFLLKFLSGLGVETIGLQDPFEFWPQESPPKRHLSEAVFTSFWQMLPNSSCQLFPAIQEIRAAQMGKRDLRNLVKINDAIFDLLPEDESVALRDILESQIPTLVRPTEKIRFELERIMAVESVTPKRLRKLFKQENASKCLEKAASEDPKVLETLLEIVKPVLDEDFKELDGCRILLLADGTLGTLRLADRPKHANHYFMANAEELKLFDFALGLLVGQKPGRAFKKAIMDSGKFNITLLDLSDIGTLFERQNFESKCPTKEMETWLGKFWDYYRRTETSRPDMKTPFRSSPGICCRPIFKATCYGIKTYIEPEMLDILPSVIEPDKPQQRSLCDKFPGIYVFSFDYLPTYLRTTETSFDTRASFTRFITTLSKLAKKEGMNLEMYIQNHLGLAEKKVWLFCNGRHEYCLTVLIFSWYRSSW